MFFVVDDSRQPFAVREGLLAAHMAEVLTLWRGLSGKDIFRARDQIKQIFLPDRAQEMSGQDQVKFCLPCGQLL